jgi:heme ABC exporter ATP-binding subunit CcmA
MSGQSLPFTNESGHTTVGTSFTASGDSSPCNGMNAGGKQVQMLHDDESLDAVNGVPTIDRLHLFKNTVASVEIRNLKKSFALKPVLRGIDLDVRRGECVALLGANGAGKTTLLRILAGLTKPGVGTVSIAGFDSVRDAQQVRGLVGLVAHQLYLYEELTALENLLFFARMYAVKHAQERARTLLQRVGLERRMQERVSTFSRGQVQRLAWARALLHSPQVLLLDEPDTGLDQQGHELIDTLLTEHIQPGGSTLFTTHQLERALQLADRVLILGTGRIVFERATAKLDLDTLQHIYLRATQ